MTSEPLTPQVSKRICLHMNNDHVEALKDCARHYGKISNPKQIKMIDLTPLAMKLKVDDNVINIPFNHTLKDSRDAHQTLVAMVKSIKEGTN